jgi:hypothetical protein
VKQHSELCVREYKNHYQSEPPRRQERQERTREKKRKKASDSRKRMVLGLFFFLSLFLFLALLAPWRFIWLEVLRRAGESTPLSIASARTCCSSVELAMLQIRKRLRKQKDFFLQYFLLLLGYAERQGSGFDHSSMPAACICCQQLRYRNPAVSIWRKEKIEKMKNGVLF